jgi:hypothetical protein
MQLPAHYSRLGRVLNDAVPFRVEYVFATIEENGGKMIRAIGRARADFALTLMAACYNL